MPKIDRVNSPRGTKYLVSHAGVIYPPFDFLCVAQLFILIDLGCDRWEE